MNKKRVAGMLAGIMVLSLGLTGCGETTATVKNSLPQEFSAYDGETLASTITINDVQCSVSDNTISVEVVGSCTYVNQDCTVEGIVTAAPSIDVRLLDEDGKEVSSQLGQMHLTLTEGQEIEESYTFNVSDSNAYTVELYSNNDSE